MIFCLIDGSRPIFFIFFLSLCFLRFLHFHLHSPTSLLLFTELSLRLFTLQLHVQYRYVCNNNKKELANCYRQKTRSFSGSIFKFTTQTNYCFHYNYTCFSNYDTLSVHYSIFDQNMYVFVMLSKSKVSSQQFIHTVSICNHAETGHG